MNYYKMRMMLAKDATDFLAAYPGEEDCKAFTRRMLLKYGATEKMIGDVFRTFNLKMEENILVKNFIIERNWFIF